MLAIFKREFKSLFWNITGWLFIGITLALFGLYFFVFLIQMLCRKMMFDNLQETPDLLPCMFGFRNHQHCLHRVRGR